MEWLVVFATGQMLKMKMVECANRWFWVSEECEIAIAIDDPEIAQCYALSYDRT